MYECFVGYAKVLFKAVTEDMPGIVSTGKELPDKAKAAKDSAAGEF